MTTSPIAPRSRHSAAKRRRVKRLALAAGVVLALLAVGRGVAADVSSAWVELRADGGLDLRTVVAAGARCPPAMVDGAAVAMRAQAAPDPAFPVRLCRAAAPARARRLAVGRVRLPSLAAAIRRLVVLGDSGCRIEGRLTQDCNDPAAWPFATIARRAAARHPDLVIDIGDYFYRETACPDGRAGCAGSPFGDNWATWRADFLVPAAPLLAAAPWIMTRGNHELCRRGGRGWFRLLAPQPDLPGCPAITAPYALHLGGLELLVFDSADADDAAAPPDKAAAYRAQLAGALAAAGPHAWLVTHRPVWARVEGPGGLGSFVTNATLEAAIRGRVPPALDLVLSGHVHEFASFSFGPQRPAQLVVGTGGDRLIPFSGPVAPGAEIDGLPVRAAFVRRDWGYLLLEKEAHGWTGTLYGAEDQILARCRLAGREIACR